MNHLVRFFLLLPLCLVLTTAHVYFDMEQIKRQFNNIFNNSDDCKRQKIQTTTDDTNRFSRKTATYFEDLSNEVVYEIFEFLDYFHVYEAFSNLNERFYNLLTHSNLPIKINLSSMSKSSLKRYNTDIIQTNIHRISSLHFSNVLIYEFVLSSIGKLSEFSRLETLILDNIESTYLGNLLDQLPSLLLLSSLVICSVDFVKDKNTVYRQIFRLPALKYCKLSLKEWYSEEILPISITEYSPIEHLIITNSIYLQELDSLLSYVPHLRRLSIHSLVGSWSGGTKISPRFLNHLTHISFQINSIKFDQFEQFVIDFFPNIEVLHLLLTNDISREYLDAHRWKQLILSHIQNLRVFDIQVDLSVNKNDDQLRIESQINQFISPFWMERQWFFAYHFYRSRWADSLTFYATNPYRKKNYTLYQRLDGNTAFDHSQINLNSVQHVHVQIKRSIIDCMNYFPNATELTLDGNFSAPRVSLATILNRIIPLQQLTELSIKLHNFSFKKIIELLYFTTNVRILKCESMAFYKHDYTSIEQSETFRFVSNTNVIRDITFSGQCTIEKLKLLLALCPRMQHLTINTLTRNLEPITRFLLDETNLNTRYSCLLCFPWARNYWVQKLDTLIKSETLLEDYTLKLVDSKLYLWW